MYTSHATSPGARIRYQRRCLNWSQGHLAEAIGTTSMSINRWEHDKALPQPRYREKLCRIFNISAATLFETAVNQESTQEETLSEQSIQEMFNAQQRLSKEVEEHIETMTEWINRIEARMDALASQLKEIKAMIPDYELWVNAQHQRSTDQTL